MNIEEILPILEKISIFGAIDRDDLVEILDHSALAAFSSGEVIFREGEPAAEMYVILSGKVEIILDLEDRKYKLCEFGIGDMFGETSVIGILNHSASAVAQEDVRLLTLSRMSLMNLYQNNPKLFGILILNIARESCRRLYKTDKILLHYTDPHNHLE